MITLWFGLPRAGKTTLIAKRALQYTRQGIQVYSNVRLDMPGVIYVRPDWCGVYDISNGVLLLDEGSIWADSRDYKKMTSVFSNWLMLHGHYKVNIEVYTQRYSGVDVKIRNLCTRCYYVRKSGLLSSWVTKYTPIDYKLIVPKDGDKTGDIVEGYSQLPFLLRLLSTRYCLRPRYYRYFDSWDAPKLSPIPGVMPCNRVQARTSLFNVRGIWISVRDKVRSCARKRACPPAGASQDNEKN